MTAEELREVLRAQVFRPFEICLADGRSLPVEHPEFVAFTPRGGRTIAVGRNDGAHEIVDLLLVTSLKPRPNGGRSGGSGKRRSR